MFTGRPGRYFFLFLLALSCSFGGKCQFPYGLMDGRHTDLRCEPCEKLMEQKPKEVLFGIHIYQNGDVYFSMNNREWFDKFFSSPFSGITVDLVSRDRYECKTDLPAVTGLPRGRLLPPLYKKDFSEHLQELAPGYVLLKVGTVPAGLLKQELEGNVVMLNGSAVCYYSNFVNIDRSVWALLPMGLFTDTLIRTEISGEDNPVNRYLYTKNVQVAVLFPKAKTTFNNNDLQPLFDSLQLNDYNVRSVEVRAYSSVEGPEATNNYLMHGRAETIVKAIQKVQPGIKNIKIITAENWLEFYQDIGQSDFKDLLSLTKIEIKQKLADKWVGDKTEPILAKHRKAIVTVYLDPKTEAAAISHDQLITSFDQAIAVKNISRARMFLKELVNRIIDNKLPGEYLNRLEVPFSKDYSAVLGDREVYRFLLRNTSEYEALENFLRLRQIDSSNGRINYNICALRFFIWQYDNQAETTTLLEDITALEKQGIDSMLVRRMLINYHILLCQEYREKHDYTAKDQSVAFIKKAYPPLTLTDEELFSLAKYFSFYSQSEWARELVEPRVDKIDVSEDLVFYYINLVFYYPDRYQSKLFQQAMRNAANLNRPRFCTFFNSTERGGAGMQLLEHRALKEAFCQHCR